MRDPEATAPLSSDDASRQTARGVPPAFASGEVIAGRFRILRFLGQGGMGQVFEAEDTELDDRVAVKAIRPGIASDAGVVERFKREVQLARQITHPNVCRIFDLYQHHGDAEGWPLVLLAMELLAGETLDRRLRHTGPPALAEALPLIRQLTAALDAAHRAGVVHRDFKTANIMLVNDDSRVDAGGSTQGERRQPRVVVTDFGLAMPAGAAEAGPLRRHGGTPAYMAPELHAGAEATAKSDLYALGLVLYELLTGRRPFAGDPEQLERLHREVAPTPPSRLLPDGLDPAIEGVVLGCLEKDPRDRPASAAAVAAAFAPDAGFGWRPAPTAAIPRRPHWVIEKRLGEGGFGEVWLAAHRKTGEQRVFKFSFDAAKLRTLEREITLFRLLKEELGDRDDIARIFDWEFEKRPYYIEGEYAGSGNLAEWAAARGGIATVPLALRLEIVAQVATALAAAHSVGVLHKDVKPQNVLIAQGGGPGQVRVQLTDFGVGAVLERQRLAAAGITVLGLTESGEGQPSSLAGTRLYMAPELLEGKPATLQADVYALGVLLYQSVVGDFSRALAPGWQRDVGDEVLRDDVAEAVDGSPERRLGNARRLAERLRSLEERRATRRARRKLRQETERARRRRRLLAAVAAVSLLFTAAMLFQERRTARAARAAENLARVATAGEWLARDPTTAALVLLELEAPQETAYAVSKMRQALSREIAELELVGHRDVIWSAALDAGGERLITGSADGTARVWDLEGDRPPVVLGGHTGVVWSAWLSPDGKRVASASRGGIAQVWDLTAADREPLVLEVGEPFRALAWSPSGDRVAAGSGTGTLRLWSLTGDATAALEASAPVVLEGHSGNVMALSFLPGGERLVSASEDGTARLWQIDGGKAGAHLVLEAGEPLWSLALGPDGGRVAAGGQLGKVFVWETPAVAAAEPPPARIFEGHGQMVVDVAFDPAGGRLVSASWDDTARVWSLTGAAEAIVLEGHDSGLWSAEFSPDGERVLTGSRDGTSRIWSLGEPARVLGPPRVLRSDDGWIVHALFDASGERVITAAQNGTMRVWDAGERGGSTVLEGHGAAVQRALWCPDGERAVTASEDGTARVWPAEAGDATVLAGHEGPVVWASFSPDCARVATASHDGTARLWRLGEAGAPEARGPDNAAAVLAADAGALSRAVFSPDGERVVTTHQDGTVRLWDAGDPGAGPIVLAGHTGAVMSAAFSPGGDRLATCSRDDSARIWEVPAAGASPSKPVVLEIEAVPGQDNPIWSVVWSPDGERVLTAHWRGTARVWDLRGAGPDAEIEPIALGGHTLPVVAVAFSPDGERVVTASLDSTARIWTLGPSGGPSAVESTVLRGHADWVVDAEFSPGGERVVTASHDGTARVWEADDDLAGDEPVVLEGHGGGLWTARFSPGGDRVLTASLDGTARIWRLRSAPELAANLRAATRICLEPEFRRRHLAETPAEARRRHRECERSHGRRPEGAE